MFVICVEAIMHLLIYNLYDCTFSDLTILEIGQSKKHKIVCLTKRNSRELYNMQSIVKEEKSISQKYYDKLSQTYVLAWEVIYTLPQQVTIDTKLCNF